MNLFKRGLTSITRKVGKSAILLVLIFVLSNIIAGAISVKNAISNTQKAMQDKIGIEVSVSLDTDALLNSVANIGDALSVDSLTPEIIGDIGASQYVKKYDYYTNVSLSSDSVTAVESEGGNQGNFGFSAGGTRGNGVAIAIGGGGFSFTGGQNPNVSAIENGDATLYQGRTFTQEEMTNGDNVILISKKLAEENNLSVGSVITMKRDLYQMTTTEGGGFRVNMEMTPTATLEFEFTVIGIFEPKAEYATGTDGTLQQVESSLVNTIYTTNTVVNAINAQVSQEETALNGNNFRMNFSNYTPSYTLNNPEDLELFVATEKSKLPQNYKFTDNAETYNNATAPMANLSWIADIVLYVAIGATIVILSLLITLFLRDRRHEMGIYLSLGERKHKIAGQILVEVLSVAMIALTLAVFSGNMLAKGISSEMLHNQVVEEQTKAGESQNPRGGGPIMIIGGTPSGSSTNDVVNATQEIMDTYTVTLNGGTILAIYLIGFGTVAISTLIPIVYTLRLKPKKILM